MSKKNDHVTHNLSISADEQPLTIGELKRRLAALSVPDDATVKVASGKNWLWTSNVSFCNTTNEVSLF
jgi:hypothetical protein